MVHEICLRQGSYDIGGDYSSKQSCVADVQRGRLFFGGIRLLFGFVSERELRLCLECPVGARVRTSEI